MPTVPTTVDPCGDFSTKEVCASYQVVHTPQQGAPRIEEDSELWDCATMGNGICGSTTTQVAYKPQALPATGGEVAVVGSIGGLALAAGIILVCVKRRFA